MAKMLVTQKENIDWTVVKRTADEDGDTWNKGDEVFIALVHQDDESIFLEVFALEKDARQAIADKLTELVFDRAPRSAPQ